MSRVGIAELAAAEWLEHLQPPYDTSGEGYRLTEVGLPAGYERYVRIFHPFVPWEAKPEDLVPPERRKTWREMAQAAGVQYHAELMWPSLEAALPLQHDRREFAVFGELDLATRRALTAVLSGAGGNAPAFYWWTLTAVINAKDPVVLTAGVADVEQVMTYAREHDLAVTDNPEYIWPADRSWVVMTDWDLTSTYVACDDGLAAALVADSKLEGIEVPPATRVDDYADRLNRDAGSAGAGGANASR